MNIRDIAYSIYTNRDNRDVCHIGSSKDSPLYTMARDEYADYLAAENKKRWESGKVQEQFLFNGSEDRAKLSKAETIALANKYNPREMGDKSYDALLDDLASMGAISNYEKRLLGYHRMLPLGGPDENGEMPDMVCTAWIVSGDETPLFDRQDAEGDVLRWINDRIQWKAGTSTDKAQQANLYRIERAHSVLAEIVNRIQRERTELAKTKAPEQQETSGNGREELLRQLADADSDFYQDMTRRILDNAEELGEEKREQAIIDALGAILDSLSGRNDEDGQDSIRETQSGLELGLNADQENTFQKGYMPLELQVFLRSLGDGTAFQLGDPEEEEAPERVADERSRVDPAERRSFGPEDMTALAAAYNPRSMDQDEFADFMDTLAEKGAMSAEAAEKIKNVGRWIVTVSDENGNPVTPLAWKESGGAPADARMMPFLFGEHSMDGDVLAWARLASADSDFQDLADILSRMEIQRRQIVSTII